MVGICIILGSCGNKSSTSFTTNVSNINKTVTNIINSNTNSASATNVNSNSFTLRQSPQVVLVPAGPYGPAIVSEPFSCTNCTFNMGQSIVANQKVKLMAKIESKQDLQNQISNALKQDNSTKSTQKSQFLQTASNSTSTATTVNEAIENLISTNITDQTVNAINAMLTNANSGIIELTGKNENLTINDPQSIVSSQIIDLITTSITGTSVKNITSNTSDIKNKDVNDQSGEGIFSLFTGVFKFIAMGIAAVVGIIVLIFLAKMIMSKKQNVAVNNFLFGKIR
jgi:hypothetical protein